MAQQIILTSDKKQVTVAPGAKTEFNVIIQNLTTLLDDVAVTLTGLDPAWVEVVPAHVPVFAQGEASVRVIVKPPLDPARAQAGVYPLQVNGRSQESGQQAATNLELEIQFGGDYRIEVGSGTALNPQEASFPLKVRNDANAALTLRCTGADPQNVFWYKVDPYQISVPPGGEVSAQLGIRSRQSAPGSEQVLFSLSAQGEWTLSGGTVVSAPLHQVNGQWGQVEPTTLGVEIHPYPADTSGRASYQVVVNNPGVSNETAALEGSSADGLLGFQFNPAQVNLAPKSQAAVNLLVWALKANASAAGLPSQALDFWVTARPLSAHARPGSGKARFGLTVAKKQPAWLIPAIIAALVFLLLCLAVAGLAYFYWPR
jgi:uncharacterized membrane protein